MLFFSKHKGRISSVRYPSAKDIAELHLTTLTNYLKSHTHGVLGKIIDNAKIRIEMDGVVELSKKEFEISLQPSAEIEF